MSEENRLFDDTAYALSKSLRTDRAPVLVMRLTEFLDAAAEFDALFNDLGYGDAEALMLAAQKLAKRAAQRANADPHFPFPKEPYYTGKAEPESISRSDLKFCITESLRAIDKELRNPRRTRKA